MVQALIWGASGGIGQALVTQLKNLPGTSCTVFGAARQTEAIPPVADAAFEFDAGDEHHYQHVAMAIAQEGVQLDLMVYAAGDIQHAKLDEMGLAGWRATLDSNLNGAYLAALHTLPLMQKGGAMIFIGAYLDHIRLPKMGAYAVAKAGLQEFVTVLRKENRKMNFTLVRPGAVHTNFWNNVSFKIPDDAKSPDVVAEAIIAHWRSGAGGDLDL